MGCHTVPGYFPQIRIALFKTGQSTSLKKERPDKRGRMRNLRNSVSKAAAFFTLLLAILAPLPANAQTNTQTADAQTADATAPLAITIVRKDGHPDGVAQMTVKGKTSKIAKHAMQAWPVRDGEGALVLIHQKQQYILRYYDLDSSRRRDLGIVPFSHATLQENRPDSNQGWAFALSGKDLTTGQPLTLVGNTDAIPGLLPGASSSGFTGDASLTWTTATGQQTIKLAALLGASLRDIYIPPQDSAASPQYLQVFPNGTAMTIAHDGTIHKGRWHTDGTTLHVTAGAAKLSLPQASLEKVVGVPAGTRFSVRMLQPLSSRTTKEGMTVKAVSIEPVIVDGNIYIPEGSTIEGTVTKANGVGWGIKHETAALTIEWNRATMPDGRSLAIDARIFEVENSQEKVNATGKIKGVRSTGTPGHSVENGVLCFAGIDPIAYIFASASGSAVMGFAEPEILYNAGTELILEYVRPLITSQTYPFSVRPSAASEADREHLQALVKTLPFRTRTKTGNKVSDLTNLIFIGSPDALRRAFTAANWHASDSLTAGSTFRTLKTISGNEAYTEAPMSILLLDERDPLFTLSKTTNTFASRHHLRVFPTTAEWDGQPVLTASSTQDIGIAFSRKQKTFIHVIDQHIDNERSKIVNDLKFTGCVTSLDMVPRPWVPTDAFNSTGDRLLTDGQVAVLHINACDDPKTTPDTSRPRPTASSAAPAIPRSSSATASGAATSSTRASPAPSRFATTCAAAANCPRTTATGARPTPPEPSTRRPAPVPACSIAPLHRTTARPKLPCLTTLPSTTNGTRRATSSPSKAAICTCARLISARSESFSHRSSPTILSMNSISTTRSATAGLSAAPSPSIAGVTSPTSSPTSASRANTPCSRSCI